mmetsp:Transcript_47462/g.152057  ORF Transcript_47462/g.152057 Transcript_47462/m.152057 type:complete len:231 (-) Transcript_47462:388-1080(-)
MGLAFHGLPTLSCDFRVRVALLHAHARADRGLGGGRRLSRRPPLAGLHCIPDAPLADRYNRPWLRPPGLGGGAMPGARQPGRAAVRDVPRAAPHPLQALQPLQALRAEDGPPLPLRAQLRGARQPAVFSELPRHPPRRAVHLHPPVLVLLRPHGRRGRLGRPWGCLRTRVGGVGGGLRPRARHRVPGPRAGRRQLPRPVPCRPRLPGRGGKSHRQRGDQPAPIPVPLGRC